MVDEVMCDPNRGRSVAVVISEVLAEWDLVEHSGCNETSVVEDDIDIDVIRPSLDCVHEMG